MVSSESPAVGEISQKSLRAKAAMRKKAEAWRNLQLSAKPDGLDVNSRRWNRRLIILRPIS